MHPLLSAACGISLLCAPVAQAEDVIVVELYTSQGCVACPPADAFLTALAQDSRVIPLALHVDYWDYIGWADSFANPRFTDRQKAYARAAGSRTIYTPQFIVAGNARIEGYEPGLTEAEMVRELGAVPPPAVQLTVERQGEMLAIRAEADPPLTDPVRVQLVRYAPEETVTIDRGENAGKTITYRNVVISWEVLGDWTGLAPLELSALAPGDLPAVVIVQAQGPGAILAAARSD